MDEELKKNISTEVRKARVECGLTQEDVAEKVDISVEFYARIERGKALPGLQNFIRIGMVLGASLDKLAGLAADNPEVMSVLQKYLPPEPEETPEFRKLVRRLREASEGSVRMVDMMLREWGQERERIIAEFEDQIPESVREQIRAEVRAEVMAEFGLNEPGADVEGKAAKAGRDSGEGDPE